MTAMLKSLRRPMARTLWGAMERERLHPPLIMRQGTAWYRYDRRLVKLNGGTTASKTLDLTGNGNTATQGTEGNQPTYTQGAINGKPGLTFDADYMTADSVAAIASGTDKPFSVFLVVDDFADNANTYLWSFGNSSNSTPFIRVYRPTAEVWRIQFQDDAGNLRTENVGTWDDSPHVLSFIFTGTSVTFRDNGETLLDDKAQSLGAITLDMFTLGAFRNSSGVNGPVSAVFPEAAFIDDELAVADMESIEKYASSRYNIPLA